MEVYCPGCEGLSQKPGQLSRLGRLSFFDRYGAFFTNFNAAFTAEAFVCVNGFALAVLHFEDFNRANIDTLFATGTFVFIHDGVKSHFITPPFIWELMLS
jgi:hypothetical protein